MCLGVPARLQDQGIKAMVDHLTGAEPIALQTSAASMRQAID
ncbi:MAG TPA: hypothetical protein VL134_11035 [Leptolyngbya sp.]|nr:hypothetical protein [Leptolyngbya sp.]